MDTSKFEMFLTIKDGHRTSYQWLDDQAFLKQLIELGDAFSKSEGELIMYLLDAYLKSPEGQRVVAIIQGRKEVAAGSWHDIDDVLVEIQAIIDGTDPGDG